MATMRDVAKRAQVSIATVSAVINESAYVTPELKQRVLDAVEELNYKPNVLAKFLRFQKTSTIGVIIRDVQNPFYPAVIKGIEDTAWSLDHIVCLCNSEGHTERELSFLQSLLQRKVDGVLLATATLNDNPAVEVLEQENIPYVMLNRHPGTTEKSNYVGIDNKRAAMLATEHLVALGRKRIAVLQGPEDYSTSQERTAGFIEVMRKHNYPILTGFMERADYSVEGGYQSAGRLLDLPDRPDAVFCANDLMAFGVIERLSEEHVRVPRDISIVGCDNIYFSKYLRTPLTTVDYPKYEMGRLAVELLLDVIEQKVQEKMQVILPPQLIIRDSCGADSKEDGNGALGQ